MFKITIKEVLVSLAAIATYIYVSTWLFGDANPVLAGLLGYMVSKVAKKEGLI